MMKICIPFFAFILLAFQTLGQEKKDSVASMESIVIRGYESNAKRMQVPAAISTISKAELQQFSSYSILPAFNAVAGVRMEERSPGSYRLSIRGSLLRSPFGVRNVKVYMDDMLFTDAGGNAYLNLLDVNSIGGAEVIKGPAGSIYGAGTGGALLLSGASLSVDSPKDTSVLSFKASGGRFGTFNESVQYQLKQGAYSVNALQGHAQADGFRDQSRMRKDNIQLGVKIRANDQVTTELLLLLADLSYQTPGGLNLVQFNANPRQSRPATSTIPSARDQRAGIFNKTAMLGISNSFILSDHWKTVTSFSTSITGFKNPFITNFEKRKEASLGIRSKFVYETKLPFPLQWVNGVEVQRGDYTIDSSGNNKGISDGKMVRDMVVARQQFVFSQLSVHPLAFIQVQAGISVNSFNYSIERTVGLPASGKKNIAFAAQLLPRFALTIHPFKALAFYGQVSKGYSSPTLAEIRPSAGGLYAGLQAEYGLNKELGMKLSADQGRFYFSTTVFQFDLKDAIVRQVNATGAEYFVNAGTAVQKGIEAELSWLLINRPQGKIFQLLKVTQALTVNDFRFGTYTVANISHAGKKMTGVPKEVYNFSVQASFSQHYFCNINLNYAGKIPLNDANTFYAQAYRLWQGKLGWKGAVAKKQAELFVLVDNMGDAVYSLGNDINAFGSRFYNPAPARNLQVGCSIIL
jgi:iron complex outermembrane receptor protein